MTKRLRFGDNAALAPGYERGLTSPSHQATLRALFLQPQEAAMQANDLALFAAFAA